MSRLFELEDERPADKRVQRFIQAYADWLLKQCVEIPSPYWPHLVNTACQRLLDEGEDDAIVRRIHRRVVRELTLTPESTERP